jgi:hypothetical protein
MHYDEPRTRIGYQGTPVSRAKTLASKALVVLGTGLMLASAFLLSVVFLAIGLAVALGFGGYLWWKTRELRRQMHAGIQEQPQSAGVIIEGEVIEVERSRR